MSKGILSEYGPESKPGSRRASCGGVTMKDKVDVMNYAMPYGPKGLGHNSPGLGGDNCGNSGTQGKYSINASTSGRPGLGGKNKGNSGTQGRR